MSHQWARREGGPTALEAAGVLCKEEVRLCLSSSTIQTRLQLLWPFASICSPALPVGPFFSLSHLLAWSSLSLERPPLTP